MWQGGLCGREVCITGDMCGGGRVTGPPGVLLFDVKPEIALKESLELQFCSTCHLHSFPVIPVTFDITCKTFHAIEVA